jgi:hypothetical protein
MQYKYTNNTKYTECQRLTRTTQPYTPGNTFQNQSPIKKPNRVNAINALLDRAMGKPRQEVEHSGDAAQPLEIFIRHFNDPIPPDNSSESPDPLN